MAIIIDRKSALVTVDHQGMAQFKNQVLLRLILLLMLTIKVSANEFRGLWVDAFGPGFFTFAQVRMADAQNDLREIRRLKNQFTTKAYNEAALGCLLEEVNQLIKVLDLLENGRSFSRI